MRSPQIVRLQQQFLASLHDKPRQWLIDQIIPAPGFNDANQVLGIYLHRAMARTIDPLNDVFKSVRWLIGASAFEKLLEDFYGQSLGEPLNAQVLASEFANFIGTLDQHQWERLSLCVNVDPDSTMKPKQALVAAAMLDWRCHWVSILPNKKTRDTEQLHKKLKQKDAIWLRPKLDNCSRLCVSGFDIEDLYQKVSLTLTESERIAQTCSNGPAHFLIHADLNHNVVVRQLKDNEGRLLNHCDGTHTVISLVHEASFYQQSQEGTLKLIHQLINEGVITQLNDTLDE